MVVDSAVVIVSEAAGSGSGFPTRLDAALGLGVTAGLGELGPGRGIVGLGTARNKDKKPSVPNPSNAIAQPQPSMPIRDRGDLFESDVSSGAR